MNKPGGAHLFQQLFAEKKAHYIATSQQMTTLVQNHAVPIFFAPPLSIGGKINGACGCVLRLDSGIFVVTASHVLAVYEERIRSGEVLNWQVGDLPPFDPLPRVAWRDSERDIVFFRISEAEAQRIGPCIISSSTLSSGADPAKYLLLRRFFVTPANPAQTLLLAAPLRPAHCKTSPPRSGGVSNIVSGKSLRGSRIVTCRDETLDLIFLATGDQSQSRTTL